MVNVTNLINKKKIHTYRTRAPSGAELFQQGLKVNLFTASYSQLFRRILHFLQSDHEAK